LLAQSNLTEENKPTTSFQSCSSSRDCPNDKYYNLDSQSDGIIVKTKKNDLYDLKHLFYSITYRDFVKF